LRATRTKIDVNVKITDTILIARVIDALEAELEAAPLSVAAHSALVTVIKDDARSRLRAATTTDAKLQVVASLIASIDTRIQALARARVTRSINPLA
jgi:hypothetical protein